MTDFEKRMAEFRARFVTRAHGDAERIEQALAEHDFPAVRSISHGLSGSAGMFGLTDLGELAQAVEEAIDASASETDIQAHARRLLDRIADLAQER